MPRLTDKVVQALRTSKVNEDFWDEIVSGFGVRVSRVGRKTFFVRYRADGVQRRVRLGLYPRTKLREARDEAREILGIVVDGEDPQAEGSGDFSFRDLAEVYLELHAKRKKKHWREDWRVLERELLPSWGDRPATEIDRTAVHEVLDRIMERGAPTMANRTRALISKIFNFGLERDIVDRNPCHGISRPAPESRRDRFLSEKEMRKLWKFLDADGGIVAASLQLRLLTAQRGVEVNTMRWADLDGEWWTIPAGVVKNKQQHSVPLSPQARQVIKRVRRETGASEWVFESPKKPGAPIEWVNKIVKVYCGKLGFDFVPHDLRRTAATHMARMGVSRLVIGKILNHADTGVTAIYDRSTYDREKRDALLAWGDRLEAIVNASEEELEEGFPSPAPPSKPRSRSAASPSAPG